MDKVIPKKISVVFIWHMHQPVYKDTLTGEYLMPWVRLHAVKDYLDMLLILEKFPKIRQTFNIDPALIDQLYDYGHNNAQDVYSRLTISEIDELSDEEKLFILNHFFDANYVNMIAPYDHYRQLYEKRYNNEEITLEDFSDQEIADITAWFNLAWFDPIWKKRKPDLEKLYNKGKSYTLKDRKRIIEIQREIIRDIIPKYKELLDKGQIEISTNPYYHPIMPLVIDSDSAKRSLSNVQLPEYPFHYPEDINAQIQKSINRFKEIFGLKPQGVWPSEHCISPETLELLSKSNISWIISDESNLSRTLGKEFVRNFYGVLQDPYDLCRIYKVDINGNKIYALFRNAVFANLIGFEYCNLSPEVAANDFYERVKTIQSKLQMVPGDDNIITIALDGENCWEFYKEDGRLFLEGVYSLLSEDETINVTTVSDYIKTVKSPKVLKTIHSGSWINRNFSPWIGDPIKNLAWDYLHKTRQDLVNITSESKYPQDLVDKAWEEIYIAEGSDWFWWYGEPNDSGQDDKFDYLFRMHLANVYRTLDKPIPEYLNVPLELFAGKPAKGPDEILSPAINGIVDSNEEWAHAGCVEILQGPMYREDKLLRRAFFGCDYDNLYLRFDINKMGCTRTPAEVYIYFYVPNKNDVLSPIRIRNKSETVIPNQRLSYSHELEMPLYDGNVRSMILSSAIEGSLWKIKNTHSIKYCYKTVLEVAVPFEDLNLKHGEEINFIIATSKSQIIHEIVPLNKVLSVRRPEDQ